uniref:Uncharacterized protein n=1 Tax=Solanum tuberosum TaxID=4113 RepID=M1D7C2_SOLTU
MLTVQCSALLQPLKLKTVMEHEEVSEMKRNNKHSAHFKSINPAANQFCRIKTLVFPLSFVTSTWYYTPA